MATQDQINDITALYIGYFDRAPDPAGLQFWIDELDNGREFNTIAEDFAASPEAEALYPYLTTPSVSSPALFVTEIYVNMFNRAPDADGLAFWVDVLESGSVSVADMIEAIINGAVDDADAGTFDKTTLNNKIEVGQDFADKTANTPGFVYDDADGAAAAAAVAVLDGVTEDPATVDAGKLATDKFLDPQIELQEIFDAAQQAYVDAADAAADALAAAQTAQDDADAAAANVTDVASAEAAQTAAEAAQTAAEAAVSAAADAQEAADAAADAAAATTNPDNQAAVAANNAAAADASMAAGAAQSAAESSVADAIAQVAEQEAQEVFDAAQQAYEDAADAAADALTAAQTAQDDADAAAANVTDLASAEAAQTAADAAQTAAEAAVSAAADAQEAADAAADAAAATTNPDDDATAAAILAAAAAAGVAASDAQSAAESSVAVADSVVESFTPGDLTLTTGVDAGEEFTGGDGNDIFNAPLGREDGTIVTQQTLQGIDNLDGGEGYDVLNAQLNDFAGFNDAENPTINNIEQYNLTVAADGWEGGLDLANASGYEVLQNINSRGNLELVNVNFMSDGEAPTIALDNVRGGTRTRVEYDNAVEGIVEQNVTARQVGSANDAARLNIQVNDSIETLNLDVADGVNLSLRGKAAQIENLNITGSGELELSTGPAFANFATLQNLDTTGYTDGIELNISGSGTLESVLTGVGGDEITAAASNFTAGTSDTTVDLGLGDNRLILTSGAEIDTAELSALDFTLGSVSNVQTLELVDVGLNADASLALEGVGGLETLQFTDFENSAGDDLLIDGGPEDLTINATTNTSDLNDAEFEMNGGLLTVNDVVNLTMNAADDIFIDGGLEGDALQTLVLNAGDDATLVASQGLDALTSIEVNALGNSDTATVASNAFVELDLAGTVYDPSELGALETVNVTAVDDADLFMTGLASEKAAAEDAVSNAGSDVATALTARDAAIVDQAAKQQTWEDAVVDQVAKQQTWEDAVVDQVAKAQEHNSAHQALEDAETAVQDIMVFLNAHTTGGGDPALKNYINANNIALTLNQVNGLLDVVDNTGTFAAFITDAEAYLEGTDAGGYDIAGKTTADNNAWGDLQTANTDLSNAFDDLQTANTDLSNAFDDLQTANTERETADTNLSDAEEALTDAEATLDATPDAGIGFEALQEVVVDAGWNAHVDLDDVYGAFTLGVTAANDAYVDLINTNVTSVTVDAEAFAGIWIDGGITGAPSLVDLTVESDTAYVWLADDLGSFETLDVSDVTTNIQVDTSGATFDVNPGDYIVYEIGATSDDDDATTDVLFTGNTAGEVYTFVGDDIGNVVINDFTVGGSATSDRLDLSAFATKATDLEFDNVGGDLVITDLGGLDDFTGTITIVGAGDQAADVASLNIFYG